MANDDDMPAGWDEDRAHWHTCVYCGMRYLCDLSDHPLRDGQSLDMNGREECPKRGYAMRTGAFQAGSANVSTSSRAMQIRNRGQEILATKELREALRSNAENSR